MLPKVDRIKRRATYRLAENIHNSERKDKVFHLLKSNKEDCLSNRVYFASESVNRTVRRLKNFRGASLIRRNYVRNISRGGILIRDYFVQCHIDGRQGRKFLDSVHDFFNRLHHFSPLLFLFPLSLSMI